MPENNPSVPAAATAGGGWTPALWGLLLVLAGNMLIDALEVSVALVALPAIGDDLGLAPDRLHWVVSGFAAGFGGVLLLGGRVVALLGRRPVYLTALAVFAAASLAGALAEDPALLIATRFVKGVCAALTAPTGLAIILSAFPQGPARNRAVSVYSLFGAAGFATGLLLSGALTEIGWRWTFAFPAPVALLLFAAAVRLVPGDPPDRSGGGSGLAGAAGLTVVTLLLVHAIGSVPRTGWGAPSTAGAFALAGVLAVLLARRELTGPRPLADARLLTHAPLARSALGAAALNGSHIGILMLSALHLQRHAGLGPWQTGLAFLPASAPLVLSALYSGRMVARLGPARPIAAGAAAAALGYALYPRDPSAPLEYATDVLPTMLLIGAAFVLAFTALHVQATSTAPAGRQAEAGGLYQTAVQLGAALTTALTAAVYTAAGHGAAVLLVTAVGAAGLVVALPGLRRETRTDPLPADLTRRRT
ncbi:MFS transporter [Streptomyces pini]|uniref:Major Facilitator Superfamily protein n=1 Tax=Streptomyces pini TaxID=1520580 RepID=A0A1I4MB38_9ACTN|nr:MFS transporter [Streptomyces pini]SFM00147.1 Major Facilitator Superfamily protein [Streptomyces pini]